MTTLTVGVEARALADYPGWSAPSPLGSDLFVMNIDEETEHLVALCDEGGNILLACDNLFVVGMLAGLISRHGSLDRWKAADGDPEHSACDIVDVVMPEVLELYSPVHIVGWDLTSHGGLKHEVW